MVRRMSMWRELSRAALDWVAPRSCPGCDASMPAACAGFCAGCAPLIEPAPESLSPPRTTAAVLAYGGPLADGIARFKYGGRADLAVALARPLARAALAYAGQVQHVVPMPLHARRLAERGYNQSALLGRHVAQALGVALTTDALLRVRDTPSQAGLDREGRVDNLRGAFKARRALGPVLLIDDVRTTGATLAAAGHALLEAGTPRVYTLALAVAVR